MLHFKLTKYRSVSMVVVYMLLAIIIKYVFNRRLMQVFVKNI